ncbi:MAG: urease subunit gamma [Streptosporangiales bacterium]|nr:urease subunit gamma [Streptosporangiales bacterium]
MHLTPAEQDRLTVFTVAELARRRRDRGALLSAPEVVALVTDAVHEAAWDGLDLDAVVEAGRGAVAADQALPGVAALVRHVEVDALFPSGTSLVAVDEPLGGAYGDDQPGAVVARDAELRLSPGRDRRELDVTNTADVDVHVSSHYPFWQTNPVLSFDRDAARGYHLDVPAGSSLCLPAGATVRVRLVALGGDATAPDLGLGER